MPSEHTSTPSQGDNEGRASSFVEDPKMWECGDPYQYPIPETEGDPWAVLLKPLVEKDKAQCEAWTDEVQNLLIFAGLFSAVVTAFAVDAYKGLQQDPVVTLLSQIAAELEGSQNNTASATPFSPTASTVRLNIFLFVSLILSLATVLVGIVALQWLRDHRKQSLSLTPQNTFATLHMRAEALEKWHVPQVFAALPLILQSALILFFAGIIEPLIGTGQSVMIPVIIVIGLTLVFLILTTMLPTLQAFTLHHPNLKLNDSIPVPCPYKSPQANAFRRLMTASKTLFLLSSISFATTYWVTVRLLLLPSQILELKMFQTALETSRNIINKSAGITAQCYKFLTNRSHLGKDSQKSWKGFDYMTPKIFYYWRVGTWLEFDLAWMSVRDNYFQSTCAPDSWLFRNREDRHDHAALYDATQGLCEELVRDNFNSHFDFESPIFVAYHCVISLSFPSTSQADAENYVDAKKDMVTRNQYLATILGYSDETPFSLFNQRLEHASSEALRDEMAFIFLYFIQGRLKDTESTSLASSRHFAEIYFRLVSYFYSSPHLVNDCLKFEGARELMLDSEDLYVLSIYNSPNQPFTFQWALTLNAFFQGLGNGMVDPSALRTSFHNHPFFERYTLNFWRQLRWEISQGSAQHDTIVQAVSTLEYIGEQLTEIFSRKKEDCVNTDVFFYATAIHVYHYRSRRIENDSLDGAIDSLVQLFSEGKMTFDARDIHPMRPFGNADVDPDREEVEAFTDKWWGTLFHPSSEERNSCSNSLLIVSQPDRHDESRSKDGNGSLPIDSLRPHRASTDFTSHDICGHFPRSTLNCNPTADKLV